VIGAGGIGLAIARRISHGQHTCMESRWAGRSRASGYQAHGSPGASRGWSPGGWISSTPTRPPGHVFLYLRDVAEVV